MLAAVRVHVVVPALLVMACVDPYSKSQGRIDDQTGQATDCRACEPTPVSDAEPRCADAAPLRTCPEVVGTQADLCEGFCHVEDGAEVEWAAEPPTSGDHSVVWEGWGEKIGSPVPRSRWIHNLEHGGVVLLYNCPESAPCDEEIGVLERVIGECPDLRILLTPDPLLHAGEVDPPRFAAVSWTWVYETDAPDLDTLACFVEQHEGQGREDIH